MPTKIGILTILAVGKMLNIHLFIFFEMMYINADIAPKTLNQLFYFRFEFFIGGGSLPKGQ